MSDYVVDTGHCVSNNKAMESSIQSSENYSEPSVVNRSSIELPSRSVYLSNKERLLLRKQALKMKKLPVIAIGIAFSSIFFLAILLVLCCFQSSDFISLSFLSSCNFAMTFLFRSI